MDDLREPPIRRVVMGHYTWLLTSLLVIYAVYPFMGYGSWMRWILRFSVLAMMVAALITVSRRKMVVLILLVVGVASQVLFFGSEAGVIRGTVASEASSMVFLLIVTIAILRDVLRRKHVDMNIVFGACCTFLLISMTWASAFSILEGMHPGSFSLSDADATGSVLAGAGTVDAQITYFSLITLTTVGYGDITPMTAPARALAAIAGLIGQLYVAIIIARLVAIEVADRMRRKPS
jgi:hypothetical protein